MTEIKNLNSLKFNKPYVLTIHDNDYGFETNTFQVQKYPVYGNYGNTKYFSFDMDTNPEKYNHDKLIKKNEDNKKNNKPYILFKDNTTNMDMFIGIDENSNYGISLRNPNNTNEDLFLPIDLTEKKNGGKRKSSRKLHKKKTRRHRRKSIRHNRRR